MVHYKETDDYEASSASATLSKDGESGVLVFLTHQKRNVFVRASRNVLVRLERKLARLLADEVPRSVPGKVVGKCRGR